MKTLLARASPARSGDRLAGLAAGCGEERVAARMALADLPLGEFLKTELVPYEDDEVTRLIADTHDAGAFAAVSAMTVGEFRDFLLAHETTAETLAALAQGLTPGNGGGGLKAHAQPGPDRGGAEGLGRHAVQQHDRLAGAAVGAAAAQPPDG